MDRTAYVIPWPIAPFLENVNAAVRDEDEEYRSEWNKVPQHAEIQGMYTYP